MKRPRRDGHPPGRGTRAERPGAGSLVAIVTLVLAAMAGIRARGEDDVVAEEAPSAPQQQSVVFFEQQLDAMLGGWQMNGAGTPAERLKGRLIEVDFVERVCGLDDEQRASCTAAAALECRRASEGVDRLRRKYAGRSADFQTPEGQLEWSLFHHDFQAAQSMLSPPAFGRSLLSRVVVGMLDDGQRARWEEETRARDARRWRVVVDGALESLDRKLGLDEAQYEALAALLVADPLRIDPVKFRNRFGDSPEIIAGLAIARLDADKVDPLLTERQRVKFRDAAQRGGMWKTMLEQWDILDK